MQEKIEREPNIYFLKLKSKTTWVIKLFLLMVLSTHVLTLSPKNQISESVFFVKKIQKKECIHLKAEQRRRTKIVQEFLNKMKETDLVQTRDKGCFLSFMTKQLCSLLKQCVRAERSSSAVILSIGFQIFSLYYAIYYGPEFSFVSNVTVMTVCQISYCLPEYCQRALNVLFILNRMALFPLPFICGHLSHLLSLMLTHIIPCRLSQGTRDNIAGIINSIVFYFLTCQFFFPELFSFSCPRITSETSSTFKQAQQGLTSLTQERPPSLESQLCQASSHQSGEIGLISYESIEESMNQWSIIVGPSISRDDAEEKTRIFKTKENRVIKMMNRYKRGNSKGSPEGVTLWLNKRSEHLIPICDVYNTLYQDQNWVCLETPYIPYTLQEIFALFKLKKACLKDFDMTIKLIEESVSDNQFFPIKEGLFNIYGQLFILNQVGFVIRDFALNQICHKDLHLLNVLTPDGLFYLGHDLDKAENKTCIEDLAFLINEYFPYLFFLSHSQSSLLKNMAQQVKEIDRLYKHEKHTKQFKSQKDILKLMNSFFSSLKEYLQLFPSVYQERVLLLIKEKTGTATHRTFFQKMVCPPPSLINSYSPFYAVKLPHYSSCSRYA